MESIKNLYNNRLSLLGAKPGTGKIDLAINLILNLALKNNKSVLFFAFDGPSNYYTQIFLSTMLNINFSSIEKYIEPIKGNRYYNITKIDKDNYFKVLETLYKSEIYMFNRDFLLSDIIDYIKGFKEETNIDFIVIDNLEILNKMYNCKNEDDIEILLQKLDKLSYEENIPILILTSLDYKKEFIKLNLLDNFKYSANILKYFNALTLLDMDYITSKKNIYKDLYVYKDSQITKLNIKHNRKTRNMQVVALEIEN